MRLLVFWLVMTGSSIAMAKAPLALEDVLAASRQHVPLILEASARVAAREGKRLSTEGAFDLELQQKSWLRADGFYDGRSVDTRLVKPLPQFGAEVSTGYRVTTGDFPVYEDELITKSAGEFNVGLVFSLLRDRAIDERRFALTESELNLATAELDVLVKQLKVQSDATMSYFGWLAAGKTQAVYQSLLDIALRRQSALEQRLAEGDVAAIFLTENQQNVLKRRELLVRAEQSFANAGVQLSLYLRDAEGRPLVPDASQLPTSLPAIAALEELSPHEALKSARAARPEFRQMDAEVARESNRIRIGENRLLPRVDLEVKAGADVGSGSPTRDEPEVIVGVNVAIPLETRKGRGAVAEARANLAQIAYQRQWLEEQLAAELQRIGNSLDAAVRFVELARQEVEQAVLLEQAEQQRFEEGASDFFLVNLREERTADARIRQLEAALNFFEARTAYYATTVDREALGLAGLAE
jgi:outer membrane protein TolC